MKNIFKQMQNLGLFSSGIVAHHYGSKLLDHKENLEESKIQAERDTKLDEIATNIKLLKDNCSSISKNDSFKNNSELSADNISSLQEQLKIAEDKSKSVLDSLNKFSSNSDFSSNKENLHKEVSDMLSVTEKINKLLDGFSKGSGEGNNFMPSLNGLYDYLNNMSLLEEASLLHILLFLVIILTVFNILVALFSNEIIKYFDLEQKYPSLDAFFKLRIKFQRYYLI